jgi:putative ABC transport system permease protein
MNDLRLALRRLGRAPGFAAVAVATLALGVGVTAVILSVVNAVLLRPLPVHEPDRLVSVSEVRQSGRVVHILSLPQYEAYRDAARGLDGAAGLAAHSIDDATVTTPAGPSVTLATWVSGNYFEVLGVTPAAGRFFDEEEAGGPGAAPVAVVSWDLWQRDFGGSRDVIGSVLHVNASPLTVVGVAPRGFHGAFLGARPAVWLPTGLYGDLVPDSDPYAWDVMGWLLPFARLGPGVDRGRAAAQLSLVARRLGQEQEYFRDDGPASVRLERFSALPSMMRDPVRGFMGLLLAAAAVVLLIAVVNLVGMQLARATDRSPERAIRRSLGAGRLELVREAAVEGGVLGLLAAAAALAVTFRATPVLGRIRPPLAGSFALDPTPDPGVVAAVAAVALVAGVACAVAPVLSGGGDPTLLRGRHGAGRGRTRLGGFLVSGQIALTVVLLISTGLLVRTLQSAAATDLGFTPDNVVSAEVNLRLHGYDEERGRAFYDELIEALDRSPDVARAALSSTIPLGFDWSQQVIRVPGHEPPTGEDGFTVGYSLVSEGYFRTLGLPLVAGRAFADRDREGPAVLIVNRTFAERFWPGESALGRTVSWSGATARIVGVVPDGKYRSYGEAPRPFAYAPLSTDYTSGLWLHARGRADLESIVVAMRREIAAIDGGVAPISIAPLPQLLEATLFAQKLAASFIGVFGGVALLLAVMGVFGILSYRVARRRRELGVRRAVGAPRRRLLGLVLRDGVVLFVAGALTGAVAAALVTRALAGLLHGVTPTDPVTYAAAAGLLAVVVVLASLVPAVRATRIDPMEVLRHE